MKPQNPAAGFGLHKQVAATNAPAHPLCLRLLLHKNAPDFLKLCIQHSCPMLTMFGTVGAEEWEAGPGLVEFTAWHEERYTLRSNQN